MKVLDPYRGYWREVPDVPERRDVTVCIAAICDENTDNSKIVVCTDCKTSSPLGSSETAVKLLPIDKFWRILTSGREDEIQRLQKLLFKSFSPHSAIDETNVVTLVREALNARKAEKANEITQGKLALSYEDFIATGKGRLPEDIFRRVLSEIESTAIEADLIVVGFGLGFATIVTTDARCRTSIYDNFAAVGEGSYLAVSAMMKRGHMGIFNLNRTLYLAYEAKRYAEGAPSVGSETTLIVMHSTGALQYVSPTGLSALRQMYNDYGPKPLTEPVAFDQNLLEDLQTALTKAP